MRSDVARDLTRSAGLFVSVVWPAVSQWCGDGRLEPVECSTAEGLARDFDVLAGIDAWQMLDDRGYMRGIASRVQWPPRGLRHDGSPWNTFTIRKFRRNGITTEFEKRLDAIRQKDDGALYPALTIQGYVGHWDELLTAAVIRTRDLYEFIATHDVPTRWVDNAEFFYVDWSWLIRAGETVRRYDPRKAA